MLRSDQAAEGCGREGAGGRVVGSVGNSGCLRVNPQALDDNLARDLWERSEQLVGAR